MPAPVDGRVATTLEALVRLRARARGFSFLPRQPVHSVLAGRHASRLRGRGLDFDELRAYTTGDDVRSLDWKVTARTRRPFVRVFTEERDRPVLLVVDQRASMFFGSQDQMKSVTAAEAAALGAWRTLAQGDRVGAVLFDDHGLVAVRPERGLRTTMRILGSLAAMNQRLLTERTDPRPERLDEALERTRRLAGHDALVVVISDFAGATDRSRELATAIAAHNDVIAVFVRDPLEVQLPDAGQLVFRQGERQVAVDTGDAGLRSRYAEDVAERLERAHTLLRQREIPLLLLGTVGDVATQVRDRIGRRAGRG